MGITSSQIKQQSHTGTQMEGESENRKDERRRSKHKRKSGEKERAQPTTQEGRREAVENEVVDNGEGFGRSQQLIPESSPSQLLQVPDDDRTGISSVQKSKKHAKSKKTLNKKRRSADVSEFFDSEGIHGQVEQIMQRSTSHDQIAISSPSLSPSRAGFSQSQHVLDEVPTDDEAAVFDEEFRADSRPSEHEIFSFSQQPQEDTNQLYPMEPPYQLPTRTHGSPQIKKHNKRKGRQASTTDEIFEEQISGKNGAGQPPFDVDSVYRNMSLSFGKDDLANSWSIYEGCDLPFDPDLHSVSALPAAVDLSALDKGDANVKQSNHIKSSTNRSSQYRKRKRVDDAQFANRGHDEYFSPYNDQENLQDRVLPGIEDRQRQSSIELGTLFANGTAGLVAEYPNGAAKSAKNLGHKKSGRKSVNTKSTDVDDNQSDKQSQPSLKKIAEKGGPWTDAEAAKLDTFRDRYCDANRINYGHFNDLVQSVIRGNPQVAALFNELYEVVPYRPRISLQKFARRRFHNYTTRGTWSAEDDDMLKSAVKEKGTSWKAVGEMIDRMPADCRDRWRNYHQNAEHRNQERWTLDEVQNLCTAILECIQVMKDARRQEKEAKYGLDAPEVYRDLIKEDDDIKLINWQAVSDRMGEYGGGRSRLQCSGKWTSLKKRDQTKLLDAARGAKSYQPGQQHPTKNQWRSRRAYRKAAKMKTGDRYELLQAILACKASDERNIPWRKLGDDAFRAIYVAMDKEVAWARMKEKIPNSESMNYHDIANQLLTRILAKGKEDFNRRWDPRIDGDINKIDGDRRGKARPRLQAGSNENGKTWKSEEFVQESDDEDEAETMNQSLQESSDSAAPVAEGPDRHPDLFDPVPTDSGGGEGVAESGKAQESDQDSLFGPPIEASEDADHDSLFDEPVEADGHQPRRSESISPRLTKRILSLKGA